MKVQDYVYHISKYGLGIVKKVNKEDVQVEFLNHGIKNIVYNASLENQYLELIQPEFVNLILKFEDSFDLLVLKKGYDYYINGKVKDITFEKNSFYVNVSGTYEYSVLVKMLNNKLAFNCTCPVGKVCKHCIAALYKVREQLDLLKEKITNKSFQQISLIDMGIVEDKLEIDFNYDFSSYTNFYNTYNEFKEKYVNKIENYLYQLELYCQENSSVIEDALTMVLLTDEIKYKAINYLTKECKNHFIKKIYQSLIDKIQNECRTTFYYSPNTKIAFYNFIAKRHFKDLIIYGLNSSERDGIIDFIIDINLLDKDYYLRLIVNEIDSINVNEKLLLVLKEKLDEEDFLDLFFSMDLDKLSLESIMMVYQKEDFLNMLVNNYIEIIFNYVVDNIDFYLNVNIKQTVHILTYYLKYYDLDDEKKVYNIINSLPDNQYLLDYLNHKIHITIDDTEVNYNNLIKYFDFNYQIIENKNTIFVNKNMTLLNDVIIDIDYYILEAESEFEDCRYKKLHINDVIEQCLNLSHPDQYQKDVEDELFKYNEKLKKIIRDNFLKDLNKTDKAYKEPILLSQERLMEIEYSIKNENNGYSISLRVGNEKKYVIKKISDFLESITRNEFVEYGKNLAFSHCFKNFKSEYKPAISYLMSLSNPYTNQREAYLNDKKMNELFINLKGLVIKFNDVDYLVRLNKIDYKINLNDEYILKSNVDNYEILDLKDSIYYLNKDECAIDLISSDGNEINLMRFQQKYKNYSIKEQVDDFIDKIYYKYSEKINLPKEIKGKLCEKDIYIKSYFDFSDNMITLNTEYLDLNNNKIVLSKLSRNNKLKYNKYNDYINELGFVDGKIVEDNRILNFLSMDFSNLKKLSEVYLSENIANKKIDTFNKQIISLNHNSALMEAIIQESKYCNEELYEILKAIKYKKKFILLKDNTILRLDNDEANDFYETVNDLKLDKKKLLNNQNLPIYQCLNAYAHLNNCKLDDYLSNMINEIAHFKDFEIEVPEVNAELRNYQVEGFKWLSVLSKYHVGGILADDMGLGKTLQIITLLKSNNVNKPSLIVCPKTLIFNWISEFNKFDETANVIEVYGNFNIRESIIKNIDYNQNNIYITSYDSLRIDVNLYKNEFKYLILDEAQTIKNVYAGKSQAVKQIKAEYRFALTGTPIENNIIDLWSIFDFIMPDYFEELSKFKSLYNSNDSFSELVSKKISPFILRRTKKDVLKDLPNKYERILTVSMNETQQKIYDSFKLQAQEVLSMNGGKAFDILPYLTKLRQICIDPILILDNYEGSSSKIEILKELIAEYIINDHKILIFSQFVKALDIIRDILNKKGIGCYYLTGDTPAKDRIRYCDEFNSKDDIKVFLISLKAGGTGLNLIGADTVIHVDPWWNQAVEQQATDRTYRIGQKRNVEVIKLICDDSIEKRVIELQNMKKDLIDKLISNDDSSITKLTQEDLKFILK